MTRDGDHVQRVDGYIKHAHIAHDARRLRQMRATAFLCLFAYCIVPIATQIYESDRKYTEDFDCNGIERGYAYAQDGCYGGSDVIGHCRHYDPAAWTYVDGEVVYGYEIKHVCRPKGDSPRPCYIYQSSQSKVPTGGNCPYLHKWLDECFIETIGEQTQFYSVCTSCACPTGQYRPNANCNTACATCTTCPALKYEASQCTAAADTVCQSCTLCPTGQYRSNACDSTPAVCTTCKTCDAGTSVIVTCGGVTNTECSVAACASNPKPANSYYMPLSSFNTDPCLWTCDLDYNKQGSVCIHNCRAGYAGNPCAPCPVGSYKPYGTGTTCINGMPCGAGRYTGKDVGAIDLGNACWACTRGYYCPAGAMDQIICPPGSFQRWYEQSLPTDCPVGSYCPDWGMTTSIPCPANKYCPYIGMREPGIQCPVHTSTASTGSTLDTDCRCDPGYAKNNTFGNTTCAQCPAGTVSRWNSSWCAVCDYTTYSRAGWEFCISCTPPNPSPGVWNVDWRYAYIEGAVDVTCGGFVCQGNTVETFDHYCMTPAQITQRCNKRCDTEGTYAVGCGRMSNGTCAACASVCPSGQYNTGCGGSSSGTCHQCTPDDANCAPGSFLSECGGDRWPQTTGTCTHCMFHCTSNTTQYTDDCTATARGTCKDCDKVCPTGQYVTDCGGVNRIGTCHTCNYCNSTAYARGCGGTSKGGCVQCGADCPTSPRHYASGCGSTTSGTCTACGQATGCGLNSPGQSFTCGSNCAQGQYASGCGGASTGVCTNCVNTANPGWYFWGCGRDSAGDTVPCPINTYRAASGGTHPDNCTACPVGSDSNGNTGATACVCTAGTYMTSTAGPRCESCPKGYYQEHRGQTTCVRCDRGKYTTGIKTSSPSGCEACNDRNKPLAGAVWKDEVYPDSTCTWECSSGYEKRVVNRRDDCVWIGEGTPPPVTTPAPQQGDTTTTPVVRPTTPAPNTLNTPKPSGATTASTTQNTPTPSPTPTSTSHTTFTSNLLTFVLAFTVIAFNAHGPMQDTTLV